MKKVYLSGAITNDKDAESKFDFYEKEFIKQGNQVINPFAVCKSLKDFTHAEIMKVCFTLIDECEVVAFMPDWVCSLGSNQEFGYAVAKGKMTYMIKSSDFLNYGE